MKKSPEIQPFQIKLEVPEQVSPACHIVGARTFLTTSTDPQLEITLRYPRRFSGKTGQLFYDGNVSTTGSFGGRRARLMTALRREHVVRAPEDIPCFDARPIGMLNWSHALNQAVPIALMARDRIREHGGETLTIVLPDPSPKRVTQFFEMLGFACLQTNARVTARFVRLETKAVVHELAREWLAPHMPAIRALSSDVRHNLPRKVFIDRRDGRHLLNGDAVRSELHSRGFTTIYPEDLPLGAQLALFQQAEDIVAIHGAGLAPLLYRTEEDGPFRFVEILSPGHMALFFRNMVLSLPVDYRALRGTPSSKMCADAYRMDVPRRVYKARYAMVPFALDLEALRLVLCAERIDEVLNKGLPLEDLLGQGE